MKLTRRHFLSKASLLGAALITPSVHSNAALLSRIALASQTGNAVKEPPHATGTLNTYQLAHFVDPLPRLSVAHSEAERPDPSNPGRKVPYYRIEMREFTSQLHRDLNSTRQWGYASSTPGPVIDTQSGHGLLVEWVNALPKTHFLPIDHTIHGAGTNLPDVRAVVHLHGAKTTPESDGYPDNWNTPGNSVTYFYPNNQDAAALWYHDHAIGITRLNIYAGLLGPFIVRDEIEDALNLPKGEAEIPLVIYDRWLDKNAQLYYPVSSRPGRPWVPEVYGNTFLINGKIYPYLNVEPRKYRLRILNCANGRFFSLSFSNGQSFYQISSDQGLLTAPVRLKNILLFPAERADVVVDFTGYAGENVILKHQAKELMQFRVRPGQVKDPSTLPTILRPVPKISEATAIKTRMLTLNEFDDYLGNTMTMLLNGAHWDMPITENPVLDTTEIWGFINLTNDAHPIHLHLVRFQVLDRRPFDIFSYNLNKVVKYTGPAILPEPAEAGWKDTVRADPGMVTRIIVTFHGYVGRYVWHCHLLEHEDNEMMRPYEVIAAPQPAK